MSQISIIKKIRYSKSVDDITNEFRKFAKKEGFNFWE